MPVTDSIYTIGFSQSEQYNEFLRSLCLNRLYNPGVAVHSDDYVLTLSTCTDDGSERLVVYARRDHAVN